MPLPPPPQEKGSSQTPQEGREEERQLKIQAGANSYAHTAMPGSPSAGQQGEWFH